MENLREDIKKAADQLPTKFGAKRELRELETHLWAGETVHAITSGYYAGGTGLLTLTNRRILFTLAGLVKKVNEDFPLDRVSSISFKSGMILGKILVHTAGSKAEITNVGKVDGKAFVDYARTFTTGAPTGEPATPRQGGNQDVAGQLRSLKQLLDEGIITDAEYESKRAALIEQL